jgi:hypothetical protein
MMPMPRRFAHYLAIAAVLVGLPAVAGSVADSRGTAYWRSLKQQDFKLPVETLVLPPALEDWTVGFRACGGRSRGFGRAQVGLGRRCWPVTLGLALQSVHFAVARSAGEHR